MNAVLPPPATSPAASAADQPLLRLQNVESAYGPIKAIRGVSLQVRRGEIAAVLGSNGAGKTTILKTISGIIDPRKGSIEFQGADITANDPAAIVRRGLTLAGWVANVVSPDMPEQAANLATLQNHLQAPMLAHWGWAPEQAAHELSLNLP